MDDIHRWLERHGLGKYAGVFAENAIDFDVLVDLDRDDLRDLGIPLGDGKRLLRAIAALRGREGASRSPGSDPLPPAGEAERRQLTVMFCDLVGSTALAQRLDPEDLREVNRAFQDACKAAIERFDGYVARYMGDGVLAYFGYPRAHEDDSERAVRAGLRVVEAVRDLDVRPPGGPALDLSVRVGIATGPVVVGDLIGDGAAQESAAVGETPNLAARLQALAGPDMVLVAPSTHRLTSARFEYLDHDRHELKGIAAPVQVWRVVAEGQAATRFEAMAQAGIAPFVGREPEIALLLERWAQSKRGEGQVMLLQGESGLGKSRILAEFQRRLTGERYTAVFYYCSHFHQDSAFYPAREELSRSFRFARGDGPRARLDKLECGLDRLGLPTAEIAPSLAALQSLPTEGRYPAPELTPDARRRKVIEAILTVTEASAARRPVLQVIEDIHWADPSMLELVTRSIERFGSSRILQLITYRPEFVPPWPASDHITSLTLGNLTRSESRALVEGVASRKRLPDEVLAQILAKTDGVPLFVEELTKSVLESELDAPTLVIPESVQDSLMARLDRLPTVRETVQLAAALGREFRHELLAAVSLLGEAELDAALSKLMEAGLLYRRGLPPDAAYAFKHALVQDVAYQSMLRRTRRRLHARIAAVLEERLPTAVEAEPELVARHYAGAGLAERAIASWRTAGERALGRSAYREATQHARKGLELLETLPDTEERQRDELGLQLILAQALTPTSGEAASDVGKAYTRAQVLCERVGTPGEQLAVLSGLAGFYSQRDLRIARELNEEMLRLSEGEDDLSHRLDAHRRSGVVNYLLGSFASARGHLERAMSLYDSRRYGGGVGLPDPRAHCLSWLGGVLWHLGYPEQAVARARESVELAHALGHPRSLAQALSGAVEVYQLTRDTTRTLECSEALTALATEHRFPFYAAKGLLYRGWAVAVGGQVEEGLADLRQGLETEQLRRPYLLGLLADVYVQHGRSDEGSRVLDDALAMVEETGARRHDAELHRLRGVLLLAGRGSRSLAEASLNRALEVARNQGARSLELRAAASLARLWRDAGEHRRAQDVLASVHVGFTEGFERPDLEEAAALLRDVS